MKENEFSVPTVEDVLRAVQDGDISIARAKELLSLAEAGRASRRDLPERTFSAQFGEDIIPGEMLGTRGKIRRVGIGRTMFLNGLNRLLHFRPWLGDGAKIQSLRRYRQQQSRNKKNQ